MTSMFKIEIGSRVVTGVDRKGVVCYIGQTKFATGDWVGIRLDKPDGKNDGSVGGEKYFECEPNHGLFVKQAQVKLDKDVAPIDSQQKLAALRERRKKREEAEKYAVVSTGTIASASVTNVDDDSAPSNLRSPSTSLAPVESVQNDNQHLTNLKQAAVTSLETPNEAVVSPSAESELASSSNLTRPVQIETPSGAKSYESEWKQLREQLAIEKQQSTEIQVKYDEVMQSYKLADSDARSLRIEIQQLRQELLNEKQISVEKQENLDITVETTALGSAVEGDPQTLEVEISQLRDQLAAERKHFLMQQDELQRANATKLSVTETETSALNEEIRHLKEQLKVSVELTSTQKAKLDSVLQDIAESTIDHQEIERLKQELQNSYELMSQKQANLDQALKSNADNSLYLEEIARLKQLLEFAQQSSSEQQSDLAHASQTNNDATLHNEAINQLKQQLAEEKRVSLELSTQLNRSVQTELELRACEKSIEELKQKLADDNLVMEMKQQQIDEAHNQSKSQTDILENIIKELQNEIAKLSQVYQATELNLQAELQTLRSKVLGMAASQQSEEALKAKLAELEMQVAELSDTVEMLTLDKEQLVVEKEMQDELIQKLQSSNQVDSTSITSGGSMDTQLQQLVEENAKLREALRRLNQLSATETMKLKDELIKAQTELQSLRIDSTSAIQLKEENRNLQEEIDELRSIVDSSSAYESMVENLTQNNLDLSQRLQTQQELLSDLEQERELMEELDARQRLELEEARRDADRAQVALVTATQKIEDLFEKLDHAHKFEQRYKQLIAGQRDEAVGLQGRLKEVEELTQSHQQKFKDVEAIKIAQLTTTQQLQQTKSRLHSIELQLKESQSESRRMEAAFGTCGLYATEFPLLRVEQRIAKLAHASSKTCLSFLSKYVMGYVPFADINNSLDSDFDDRSMNFLQLSLRCTCLIWNIAIASIYTSNSSHEIAATMNGIISNSPAVLYLEKVSQFLDTPELAPNAEEAIDSLYTKTETTISEIEFEVAKTGGFAPSDIVAAADSLIGHPVQTVFQISYYAHSISAIAYWLSQLAYKEHKDTLTSVIAEVDSIRRLVTKGRPKHRSDIKFDIVVARNALLYAQRIMIRLLEEKAKSLTLPQSKESLVVVFDASAIRQCLSFLREASTSCKDVFDSSNTSSGAESEMYSVSASIGDIVTMPETIWTTLISKSSVHFAGVIHDDTSKEAVATWTLRCEGIQRNLAEWEKNHSQIQSVLIQKQSVEYELELRKDELKAALARCEELTLAVAKAGSANKRSTGLESNDEKIREDIKALTEALDVLEKRYADLGRENKALKAASRSSSSVASNTITPSQSRGAGLSDLGKGPTFTSSVDLSSVDYNKLLEENARVALSWQSAATHRLLSSLAPLTVPWISAEAVVPDDDMKKLNGKFGRDLQYKLQAAKRVYRDARLVRASVTVFDLVKGRRPGYSYVDSNKGKTPGKALKTLEEYAKDLVV